MHRIAVWLQVFRQLARMRKENNIIGLFSFWCSECALVGKYFGAYNGIKHLSWISGQDARKDNRYVRFIQPKSGELIAKSDFLAKEFLKNHHVLPAAIIPNGIDTEAFHDLALPRDIDISAAGSLIRLKQYEIFIDIVDELRQHLPAIKTLICGKGPEEENLRAQINRLQLANHISLPGETPHANVLQIMQRSKIFLHTSSYEGSSSVCLEALYAGAQVISFWQPDGTSVKHWHVVRNKEEMVQKALELLLASGIDHKPVLVQSMHDSARAVMALFR
jgi:glycosyltransferase involved in cell wall biosynthesis